MYHSNYGSASQIGTKNLIACQQIRNKQSKLFTVYHSLSVISFTLSSSVQEKSLEGDGIHPLGFNIQIQLYKG